MSNPLQLVVPETAQIHIHFGPATVVPGSHAAISDIGSAPLLRRHPLLLASAAILLFGSGYVVRGMTAQPAAAETSLPRPVALPPPPLLSSPRRDELSPALRIPARPPVASQTPGTPPSLVAPRSPFGLD